VEDSFEQQTNKANKMFAILPDTSHHRFLTLQLDFEKVSFNELGQS